MINTSQWSRVDEPILSLAAMHVVDFDGVGIVYLSNDSTLAEIGRVVLIGEGDDLEAEINE